MTDRLGHEETRFRLNDAASAFRIIAEGNTWDGAVGRGEPVVRPQPQLDVAA